MWLKQFIYHSRPINLLIVAITQAIILAFLFSWDQSQILISTSTILIFGSILLCTSIITICGYLINDYFDYEIDSTNKSSQIRFDKITLLKSYFGSIFIGLLLGIYLAFQLEEPLYLSIYLLAVILLFCYASYFKQNGLIGNFVVSLFSSLVVAIIWYVFELTQFEIPEEKTLVLIVFMCCLLYTSPSPRDQRGSRMPSSA